MLSFIVHFSLSHPSFFVTCVTEGSSGNYEVDHASLASSYHSGIICGFALIASSLESAASLRKKVNHRL